jgi:YggT family protein
MGTSYFTDPLIFIIDALASLYILAIMLRFLLQWCGASFYNAIGQFLVKVSHLPLKFLRRFIPPIGRRIDTASLILMLALQMLVDFTVLILKGNSISIGALTVLSLTQLISMLINVYVFAVFASALLSWVDPGGFHTTSSILRSLTEPLLETCRRFVPDIAGVDLSPLLALMLLQLSKMVILPPLQELANLIG